MNPVYEKLQNCYESVRKKTAFEPKVALVLGSGLGKFAEEIDVDCRISYSEIEGFPTSTVPGHAGQFVFGYVGDVPVVCMQGRVHYYEGYPMEMVTLPIRVMKVLGIKYLFVSNAAGGINYDFKIGDLVIIKDHINMLPNPLIGPNLDDFGPRFPDMTRPYDRSLIAMAHEIAGEMGLTLKEGVYFGGTGPTYETPSEYKYIRKAGGDMTGMSTVPEVIVARHSDIPVFGMSVVTNEAHDDYAEDYVNDGEDVVKAADAAADKMSALFERIISRL